MGKVAAVQILMMGTYTLIITVALPELWLHPYGPVSKNVLLIIATLIMMQMEKR
ncbi:MAG: hypothetical protein COB46_01845 [Rhodospirillaceae bacterium]|nr:MAG: hypothetical protein COB46_01845 [Rhodospirillaceae bacterium]